MDRAKRFYERVLALSLEKLPTPGGIEEEMQMMAFPIAMSGPGSSGALVKMEGFSAGNYSTIIYFDSKDCSIEGGRIKAAGGKVVQSRRSLS
jgi:hypothetical protein